VPPGWQLPTEKRPRLLRTVPLQEAAGPQATAGNAQVVEPPAQVPAHSAVPPQGARGERGAPVTVTQVPGEAGSAHPSHWPAQARSQQTPSTQKPLAQSPVPVQPLPRRRLHAPAASQVSWPLQ
jgi:hypothetical protein